MKSDAVKLAELQNKRAREAMAFDAFKLILTNPGIELVGGFLAVDMLSRERPIPGSASRTTPGPMNPETGNTLKIALALAVGLQMAAPIIPPMIQANSKLLDTASDKVLPLLLTKGIA